jgi:methylenetetrahydrofolate reductase (NADPH)
MVSWSFEFFPARTEAGFAQLVATAKTLAKLSPSFMTVTYGAGGSTREGTFKTVTALQRETGIPMASHLTFCATKRDDLDSYIQELQAAHIGRIIALRGDLPAGHSFDDYAGDEYFQRTSDFVEYLKYQYGFDISVAAYPEKHPMAPTLDADIEALRLKCEAGADRAITQFFFDDAAYDSFMEKSVKAGIKTQIVPGLMAIADFSKLSGFAGKCGAGIPNWLAAKFENVTADDAAHEDIAAEVLARQIDAFRMRGAAHIHIYTMNKPAVTLAAISGQKTTTTDTLKTMRN